MREGKLTTSLVELIENQLKEGTIIITNNNNKLQKSKTGSKSIGAEVPAQNVFYETIAQHLELGADVNERNKYGITPLMYAANNGNLSMVNLLLSYGADVNAAYLHSWTPLMLAVYNEHIEIVKILIGNGAKVNYRNYNDDTALIIAMKKNNQALIEILNNASISQD